MEDTKLTSNQIDNLALSRVKCKFEEYESTILVLQDRIDGLEKELGQARSNESAVRKTHRMFLESLDKILNEYL